MINFKFKNYYKFNINYNCYGIRDPIIINNLSNTIEDENFMLIFNCRKYENNIQKTYISYINCNDLSFNSLKPKKLFQDSDYTAAGSIVKEKETYTIYYSTNTKKGFKSATSNDLKNWNKSNNYFLKISDFKNIYRMGLPYVTKINNIYYCIFEGLTRKGFHIYMATSNNANIWTPYNDGYPIYKNQYYYEKDGQANPSLYYINNKFIIFYNGCLSDKWSGSYLITSDFKNYSSLHKPLIDVSKISNSYRIEGLRLITYKKKYILLFFILPTGDSYYKGDLYYSYLII
tara:strand:- start:3271 stop:4134 length:864 start_codon:yes stop_codon:yes gene_type:complete